MSDFNKDNLGSLLDRHRRLDLIRACEELIVDRYAEDEMKTPMHMSWGQEACAVGVSDGVGEQADFFTTYRSHAIYLARTLDVQGFFGELLGTSLGKTHGVGGSMHLSDIEKGVFTGSAIVGGNVATALGAAFANKKQSPQRISVCMFGDGALDRGSLWESLNIANLYRLPVLFICEDNNLAVSSLPGARRHWGHSGSLEAAVRGFGTSYSDLRSFDVHGITQSIEAIAAQVRETNEPHFLRLGWHRHLEHVGVSLSEFPEGQRKGLPIEESDPLVESELKLIREGIKSEDIRALEAANRQEVRRVYESIPRSKIRSYQEAARETLG